METMTSKHRQHSHYPLNMQYQRQSKRIPNILPRNDASVQWCGAHHEAVSPIAVCVISTQSFDYFIWNHAC